MTEQEKEAIVKEFKSHYRNDDEAYFALCCTRVGYEKLHHKPLTMDAVDLMAFLIERRNKRKERMKRRIFGNDNL